MSAAVIDLGDLHARLRIALPQLSVEMVELEHAETRRRHPAISVETTERKHDHVYKMTIAIIEQRVNFFVHIWGKSKDLTTRGSQHFSKACADIDEVFAIVHSCWSGSVPS